MNVRLTDLIIKSIPRAYPDCKLGLRASDATMLVGMLCRLRIVKCSSSDVKWHIVIIRGGESAACKHGTLHTDPRE